MTDFELIQSFGVGLISLILDKKSLKVSLTADDKYKYVLADSQSDVDLKYIIAVLGRNFHTDKTNEYKSDVFNNDRIRRLEAKAKEENSVPVVAFVFIDDDHDEKVIRLFLIELKKLRILCNDPKVLYVNESQGEKNKGIRFKYNGDYLNMARGNKKDIDYTELTVASNFKDTLF